MSIQYRFVPIYDNLNEDSEKVTGFYPKVVSRGTINKERMFEEISHGSSSLRSELARSWMLMEDYIIDRLKDGYDVCLNDFCTFGISAKRTAQKYFRKNPDCKHPKTASNDNSEPNVEEQGL